MLYFAFAYGILTIIGGLMGYLQAKSTMSLVSGGVSGLLILLSAFALLKGKAFGYYGIIALALLLAVFFGMRFFQGFKFMPAGLMLTLSVITLIGFFIQKNQLLPTNPN